jgi:putative transcriptional regulator
MEQTLSTPWLLLATPQLTDPHFAKAVVLITQHNNDGSVGFVINQPMQTPLANLIDAPQTPHSPLSKNTSSEHTIPKEIPVWYGGPVGRSSGIIMHRKDQTRPDLVGNIFNHQNFAVTSANDSLAALLSHETKRLREMQASRGALVRDGALHAFRFIVGYAGWAPGQLNEEMRQGAWIQAPVTEKLLFSTAWSNIWEAAMAHVGIRPASLAPTAQAYLM